MRARGLLAHCLLRGVHERGRTDNLDTLSETLVARLAVRAVALQREERRNKGVAKTVLTKVLLYVSVPYLLLSFETKDQICGHITFN